MVQFVKWCVALQANPREIIGEIWLFEMDEQTAAAARSWADDKAAAENKGVSYLKPRRNS